MLYETEETRCPILDDPGNYHFEGRCEDCDVKAMARRNLGDIEDLFCQHRLSRSQLDAYRWVWALLSPTGSNPHWKNQPYVADPDVRRIARKLCRARGFDIPAPLTD